MTERLTQEAALGLARHIAARIADRDGATALAADIRGGFHDVATEVKAALEAIRAMECHHEAENARLRAALEDIRTRLTETPTMPSYLLGQIMAYIDDRARAALTDTGAA